MAKLATPMLGFGASGQIAKTVVAYAWRGLHCLRAYVIPNDPKTAAQLAQRQALRAAVRAWKLYILTLDNRRSWNQLADFQHAIHPGYNEAISNLTKQLFLDPSASFVQSYQLKPPSKIQFNLKDMDDGSNGSEVGDFEVWLGTDFDSLSYFDSYNMTGAGTITTDKLGELGDCIHIYLKKGTYRSGITTCILV